MSDSSEEREKLRAEAAAKKAEAKALRPWYKKKRFALPTILIFLAVISSLGSNSSTKNQSANSASERIAKIGQEARDGKFAFTVNSIDCNAKKVGSYILTTKPQGSFGVLDILVKNIGQEAQSVNSDNMYLYDQDGRKFSTANSAMQELPNSDLWYTDINPGNFVRGQLIFDMPFNITVTKAELHDSAFSGGVIISLN